MHMPRSRRPCAACEAPRRSRGDACHGWQGRKDCGCLATLATSGRRAMAAGPKWARACEKAVKTRRNPSHPLSHINVTMRLTASLDHAYVPPTQSAGKACHRGTQRNRSMKDTTTADAGPPRTADFTDLSPELPPGLPALPPSPPPKAAAAAVGPARCRAAAAGRRRAGGIQMVAECSDPAAPRHRVRQWPHRGGRDRYRYQVRRPHLRKSWPMRATR